MIIYKKTIKNIFIVQKYYSTSSLSLESIDMKIRKKSFEELYSFVCKLLLENPNKSDEIRSFLGDCYKLAYTREPNKDAIFCNEYTYDIFCNNVNEFYKVGIINYIYEKQSALKLSSIFNEKT
jgi:hypothetical protein